MKNVCTIAMCVLVLSITHLLANNELELSKKSVEPALSRVNSCLYTIGAKIHDAHVPLLGRLGDILPFALIGFSLQNFPGQTMLLMMSGLVYTLYYNDHIYRLLRTYNFVQKPHTKRSDEPQKEIVLEDDFFVFDGDDLLDAEEEEDLEEALLKNTRQKKVTATR